MKKKQIVMLMVVILALVMGTAVVHALNSIDTFNDTTQSSNLGTTCTTVSSPGTDIRGVERDILVNRTSGGGTVVADANDTVPDSFSLSIGASTQGTALIQWDGVDGSCALNARGLAPLSLSPDDGIALYVRSVDLNGAVTIRVYTDQSNYSTYSAVIPTSIIAPGRIIYFPFESFTSVGAGANFGDVGAIELLVDGTYVDSLDMTIDFVNSDLTRDFGDLPSAYNAITLEATNGARNVLGTIYLGNGVDADPDGQTSSTATGDTLDDGITLITSDNWGDGSGQISVKATIPSGIACIVGWIDWNGNGTFDVGGTTGGVSELVHNAHAFNGTRDRTITTPNQTAYSGGIYPATLNARFRIFEQNADLFTELGIPLDDYNCPTLASFGQGGTATEAEVAGLLTGVARNGEVEDYQWGFGPNAVSLQSFSAGPGSSLPVYGVIGFAALVMVGLVALALRRERKQA